MAFERSSSAHADCLVFTAKPPPVYEKARSNEGEAYGSNVVPRMLPGQSVLSFTFTLLILSLLFLQAKATQIYPNSYVHLSVTNKVNGRRTDSCANYLQYRHEKIAETFENAEPYSLKWWRNVEKNMDICPLPRKAELDMSYKGAVVPLKYRVDKDGTLCTKNLYNNFRGAAQFQIDSINSFDASAALFTVEKGRQFLQGWRDFLFLDFYDPSINISTAPPTFFLYKDVFDSHIRDLADNVDDLELRFYRPRAYAIEPSMVFIWIISMTCVAGGGFWAFYRHRLGKDQMETQGSDERVDENLCCTKYGNYFAIGFLMGMLTTIMVLGYYFRGYLVFVFNVALVIFGSFSVYGCLRALFSNFAFSKSSLYLAEISVLRKFLFGRKLTYVGILIYLLSLAPCVYWYVVRRSPYAFILLDLINMTICLHILKSLRLPSLKWITLLMFCMFIYDLFMVFGTKGLTKNGCSVMLEVATGMDCSKVEPGGYPIPPVDSHNPEKFPMLIQVPRFDVMHSCIDLVVEDGFQASILGLGDIIIPGYMVVHSFTMNGIGERGHLVYGTVCVFGYGIGLIVTFFALMLTKVAQPALIYLVPCTVIPIFALAFLRGEFVIVWNGAPQNMTSKSEESNSVLMTSKREGQELESNS
ncbi:unnamed protein product [Caenorhabditis auriculariae]|uniref:Uncharacterized protein n=1 Tax=Caenorhabditis auriculariae TaxID=2777116 RepID=A0A8S1GP41_9PELO|nr:unnamed protein product [Caenorhabditis auriculariae]